VLVNVYRVNCVASIASSVECRRYIDSTPLLFILNKDFRQFVSSSDRDCILNWPGSIST